MPNTAPLEDVLFVAIETVPQSARLRDLPPRLGAAWEQKVILTAQLYLRYRCSPLLEKSQISLV